MPGPSWLGIGAQRSGTDWVSRLLVLHPKVEFGTNGKKEQSLLQRVPDGEVSEEEYLALFPDDGSRRGEWSPRYLASMIVPGVAQRVLTGDAPLLVLLRDPVERFASGMRYAKRLGRAPADYTERVVLRAHQAGNYASALEGWATVFGRDRFVIATYEEAREDVEEVCHRFWAAMGVEPHPLADPYARVKSATEGEVEWRWPDRMRDALVRHYLPQVLWLRDHWGVDVTRWKSFDGLL